MFFTNSCTVVTAVLEVWSCQCESFNSNLFTLASCCDVRWKSVLFATKQYSSIFSRNNTITGIRFYIMKSITCHSIYSSFDVYNALYLYCMSQKLRSFIMCISIGRRIHKIGGDNNRLWKGLYFWWLSTRSYD